MERLHHALPIKIKIVKFKCVGGRECGKNCFGATIYVWDRPGPPLSQISKIIFCSPPFYMIPQPPPKNKVIWWWSGLGVNTTTLVFLAGISLYIRPYTVLTYSSGQPYKFPSLNAHSLLPAHNFRYTAHFTRPPCLRSICLGYPFEPAWPAQH